MASRAGRPNKNKDRLLRQIKEEFPNYDPIIELCRTAMNEDNTPELRFNASKEVCQYVYPKLKAVEHTGDMDHNITFSWAE